MQGGEGWARFIVIAMVTGLPLANESKWDTR